MLQAILIVVVPVVVVVLLAVFGWVVGIKMVIDWLRGRSS
jgi:hypothetical protein